MAHRRMISQDIVDTDNFAKMSQSARYLYYELLIRADDDGFLGAPMRIVKMVKCAEKDLNELINNAYIIKFANGIIVIRDWKVHNNVRKDIYQKTVYQDEFSMLCEIDKKYYLKNEHNATCNVTENATCNVTCDGTLGKDRLGKDKKSKELIVSKDTICTTDVARVIEMWNSLGLDRIIKINKGTQRYSLLKKRIEEYGMETITGAIEKVRQSSFLNGGNNKGWTITFDWFIRPNNFPKVIGGNYDNNRGGKHDKNGIRQMLENVEKKYEEN